MLALILAQVDTSRAVAEWTGWAQLGALGAFASAFLFFMRHMVFVVMPKKEQDCKEEREMMLGEITKARIDYERMLDKAVALFESHNKSTEDQFERRHKEMLEEFNKLREKNHALNQQLTTVFLERNSKGGN